jgi:hypothetical protein
MAKILLEKVTKHFGDITAVLDDDLKIDEKVINSGNFINFL